MMKFINSDQNNSNSKLNPLNNNNSNKKYNITFNELFRKITLNNNNNNNTTNNETNNKNNFSRDYSNLSISNNDESKNTLIHSKTINIFNKLNSIEKFSKKEKPEQLNKRYLNDNELKKIIENKELNYRRLKKIEKIYDTNSEDEDSENEIDTNWVIMPENAYKSIWNLLISYIIIYCSIFGPYQFAFINKENKTDKIIEILFEIIFTIDIILNFFSAFIDKEDNIIKNHKKIIYNYLTGWFIIDVISALPFHFLINDSNHVYNTIARLIRLPRILSLIRLFKLIRMVRLLKNKDSNSFTRFLLDIFKINANIERLIYFIFAFLLLNHLAACLWYWIAKIQDFNPDCWVTRLGYIDSSNFEIYIVSFYWTLTTVTTVGYGDVNAGTNIERVYNLFFMSFGVIMYSFAIGSLSSIVSTLDDKTAEMNQKLQILSSIKKEFNLDQEIYNKVRKLIKYDLSRNQKDKMDFLQELPNKLRIELSQIMHDNIIHKIYFFKYQPNDFIAYLTPLLKSIKFSQNDYLYKCNDVIDEMYFILKGTIILCLSKDYKEKELKEIKKYHNFGEIEMCLNEKLTHNIKVKSRSCELFVLKKNDFLRLSVNFKDYIEKFLQKSLLIYLRFTEIKAKIIEQMNELKNMENEIRGINNNNDAKNNHFEDEDEKDIDEDLIESGEETDEEEENDGNEDKSSNNNNETSIKSDEDKSFSSSSFDSNKCKESSDSEKNSKAKSKINTNENKSNKSNEKKENNNENNFENPENIKNKLNEKFIKKVNKIIDFLEKNNINLGKNENGIDLLKKLININNLSERNEILEKIEKIVNDQFKQKN